MVENWSAMQGNAGSIPGRAFLKKKSINSWDFISMCGLGQTVAWRAFQKDSNRGQNLETPLHFALIINHEEFVLLLIKNGAFFNAKDQNKITPIEDGLMSKQMTAFKTILACTQF